MSKDLDELAFSPMVFTSHFHHLAWNLAQKSVDTQNMSQTGSEDSGDYQSIYSFHHSGLNRVRTWYDENPDAQGMSKTGLEDSTREMQEYVLSQIKEAKLKGHKINIQATCYSYSGVDTAGVNANPLSLLKYNAFFIDPTKMILTVQPGVRFLDVVKEMKKHKVSLPSHGSYGGQTVIGGISTGSHGSGLPALHNFVLALKVVNGNGDTKTVTSNDPEFGAWVNSVGSLGVILEATIALVHEFNVQQTLTTQPSNTLNDSVGDPQHFSDFWNMYPGLQNVAVLRTAVTKKAPTIHDCCFFSSVGAGSGMSLYNVKREVLSYNDDLIFPFQLDPPRANDGVCRRHENVDVWVHPGWHIGSTMFGAVNELNVPAKEFMKSIKILNTHNFFGVPPLVQVRRVLQDTAPNILLSPYYDGDRISLDISRTAIFRSRNTEQISSFHTGFHKFVQKLIDEGIDVRYHIGKNLGSPFWSKTRADKFLVHKVANDNNSTFTNNFLQRLKAASQ